MKMIWWEKTVEYYFVRNYLSDADIAPFDGDVEKLGDALVNNNAKSVLIEFKRNYSDLKTDRQKYKSYENALENMENEGFVDNNFHIFIFGKLDENGKFALSGRKYWLESTDSFDLPCDFNDYVSKNGADIDQFNKYIKILFRLKGGENGSLGGYAIMAKTNKGLTAVSLSEYLTQVLKLEIKKELKFEQKPEQSRNFGPGM
ncbi:hypothetical protein [Campylobacter majalis]|uniref:hypothetical protein n=1 Tax=Campylobacter majalis TaxID=2790656 RepID=UPI003D69C880